MAPKTTAGPGSVTVDSSNAILYYEATQDVVDFVALTDQGDHIDFKSADTLWSKYAGSDPDVKPNGQATGLVITPAASGSNDVVDISAGSVFLSGVETAVSAATDQAIVRPAVSNYQKFSITINSGGSIAVVDGAEHTAFSTTRGANGGPPWIPTTSVEIGQIWVTSQTPAAILASEIKQVEGTSLTTYKFPVWNTEYVDVESGILGYAGVKFVSALPLIHSDDAGSTTFPKKVFAQYSTPQFAEAVDAYGFVPPANSYTVNTTAVYGRTKGSTSPTLNAGTFNIELEDGISDNLMQFVDQTLWFKFLPNRLKTPYILCNGKLSVVPDYPADANNNATCTIAAETVGVRVTT